MGSTNETSRRLKVGYVLRRAPDTVRGPDISFISLAPSSAWPRMAPDRIPVQFIPGAPDLAVEILSPDDRWSEMEEKVADYLEAGARMVWLVDPREQRVVVRYPDRASIVIAADGTLGGEDVVPGFQLPLAGLFGSR